jgi:hypothetical protein
MDTQKRARLEITDRQGNRIVSENAAGQTIATLQGAALSANRGTSLNLDWVESVRGDDCDAADGKEGLADCLAAAGD